MIDICSFLRESAEQEYHDAADEILRLRAENEKLQAKCETIYDELLEAKGQVVKLRAALKPFADIAGYYDVEPDDQPAWDNDFQPTVGELRAAAAALKETGD